MAHKKSVVTGSLEPQQEEMTVVVVKFKGGPESMQKGFEAVNNAILALGPAQQSNQTVLVHRTPAAQLGPETVQTRHVLDAVAEESEAEAEEPEQATPDVGTPTKPRKSYTFMSDFNLSPAGLPSLKEYCGGKKPQSDNEKFLVASAWVQTHGGADPFSGRHLFTVFRAMEWKTQSDMTQPMRRLKSEKSYFENPSSGKWKLTGIGLEAADKVGK